MLCIEIQSTADQLADRLVIRTEAINAWFRSR